MLISDKKIAIVGGGPGGLTLARLLQRAGANVQVYERDHDKDVRVQGGALDLHEDSGLAALRAAGLIEAFKANYRPGADKIRIVDRHANILYDDHEAITTGNFGDEHFRPEIDRGPLRDILLDALQPGTVVYDSHIVSLTPVEDSWKLVFRDGRSVAADIVIAADGANSKIRPFITPIKPFFVGITMIEGSVYDAERTTPKVHKLLKGGKIFAMGDDKTLIVSSKGDGSMGFATGCKTDEYWWRNSGIDFKAPAQLLTWFKNEFVGWDAIWYELFENEQTSFIVRPQYCMPLDQTWDARSNITMLGDAAHWMPPYAGEGVNMAMLDALELSECLTNTAFPNLRTAIANYERQMRVRFTEIGKMTLESTASLHSPDAIKNMMSMFGQ